MPITQRLLSLLVLILVCLSGSLSQAEETAYIPILCYHNFNPSVPGSMTLKPATLEAQIKWMKDNGFTFITLKQAVLYLQGKTSDLPKKPVVLTADDGWQSVYKYLYPLAKKYQLPVTLFIYPQTISGGKNAMTWEELRELQQTGLFDIQGHTYWHPNFHQEKKHMTEAAYDQFVDMQLGKSRKILEEKMGKSITLLAWPFGIYDANLEAAAARAGYEMAFSIDARSANRHEKAMSQPRFMIVQGLSDKHFQQIASGQIRH